MNSIIDVGIFIVAFGIIALASKQIGHFFAKFKLPLITGFLFAGIITGPFGLKLISSEAVHHLRIIDEISLAFIAFAAGSELQLQELKNRMKSIVWITLGLVISTFSLGMASIFFVLKDHIPFMQSMSSTGVFAISMLAGVILVARSPSSVIAIINELRAKGPFTQTALGVTVVLDVVVIFLFAATFSMTTILLSDLSFDFGFVVLLLVELILSLTIGFLFGKILHSVLGLRINRPLKAALLLGLGLGMFIFADQLEVFSHTYLPYEIILEPILLCMIGSFVVINTSQYRAEFVRIIHETGPLIYVSFFTLTGASLELDILMQTWTIALTLFFVRVTGIFIGSFTGGIIAGEPMSRNKIWLFGFVTQAGVAIGLSKEVAAEFPDWGPAFATMIISLVVLNEVVGPILFKWAINRTGEAHNRAETPEFDGVRDAIIFGHEDQAVALAQQLSTHGWQVRTVCQTLQGQELPLSNEDLNVNIQLVPEYTLEILRQLEAHRAEAIVTLLSDEENFQICELAYEHFGTKDLIVRLNDRANFRKFHDLGALIVDPSTAMVSLFDHLVRSPVAASIMLGMDENQDMVDIEVCDPLLDGVALRDLRLPDDALILSVQRDGHVLISHGYTRIRLGDYVTAIGPQDSLDKVMVKLGV